MHVRKEKRVWIQVSTPPFSLWRLSLRFTIRRNRAKDNGNRRSRKVCVCLWLCGPGNKKCGTDMGKINPCVWVHCTRQGPLKLWLRHIRDGGPVIAGYVWVESWGRCHRTTSKRAISRSVDYCMGGVFYPMGNIGVWIVE